MNLTYEELMAQFDEELRPKVQQALESVSGLAVYRSADKVKVLALTPTLEPELDGDYKLVGTYVKPLLEADTSRTQQALRWMKETGGTPYAAAKQFGLDTSAVYRGLKRAAKTRCPCCGQTLKG